MRTYIVRERSSFPVRGRLQIDGEPVTQAQLTSITWKVYPEAGGTVVASGALTISTSVFDTLQTGEEWTEDETGYNLWHQVASTVLTDSGRFHFEYKVTPTSGSAFFADPILIVALPIQTP